MSKESGSDSALDMALRRLDRAMVLLEQRLAEGAVKAGVSSDGLLDQDNRRLVEELKVAKAREAELEQAGAEASRALSRAMSEIRDVLDER